MTNAPATTEKKGLTLAEVKAAVLKTIKEYPFKMAMTRNGNTVYKTKLPIGDKGLVLTGFSLRLMTRDGKPESKVDTRAIVGLEFNADPADTTSTPAMVVYDWRLFERRKPEESQTRFTLASPSTSVGGKFVDNAALLTPGMGDLIGSLISTVYTKVLAQAQEAGREFKVEETVQ